MNKYSRRLFPYLMLAPLMLVMIVLVYYPIIVTFLYSFMKMDLTKPQLKGFTGLKNYVTVLKDPDTWNAAVNSIVVLVEVLVLTIILGLVFSLLLNKANKAKGVLTAIAIIPWALPPVVNGILWRWIFHPSYGFLNAILLKVHAVSEPIQWLSYRFLIIAIVSIVVSWRAIPLATIIYLSTMQSIPQALYEAGEIDGCTPATTFLHITFPLLRPAVGITLTMTSITAITVFDEIVTLIGYATTSRTLMLETYLRAFKFLDFGVSTALIYLVMIAASMLGVLYTKRVYKEVEYL